MVKNKKSSYKKKNQSRQANPYALAALFLVVLVAVGGLFAYKQFSEQNRKDDEPVADARNINTANVANSVEGENKTDTGDSINAKEQALKAAEEKEVAKNDAGLKIAEVYIANVGQDTNSNVIFASGVITNVVNNSGTCTYTFTNGSQTVTATGEVLPSAKETICSNVEVSTSQFSAGDWTVKLNFKSDYAEGESDATTFTIQ